MHHAGFHIQASSAILVHHLAGITIDPLELGSSLLIPGGTFDLHASKEVQAEAPLWALMAKEATLSAF